jgi:hypothetical protein
MNKTALFIGLFLLLVPAFASAQTQSSTCSANGYTVVFFNGIFDSKPEAENDAYKLGYKLGSNYNGQPLTVQLGYNATHLAGAGDILQTAAQLFSKSVSNFDLNTILMEVYPEVTTRKLLLVGHSQGAMYANDMYHYLLSNGEPDGAVAVYNVASPAAYTAGHGKYLTSSGDPVINGLRALHFDILPNNIDLVPSGTDAIAGHYFVEDYLNNAGPQMQSDITGELNNLQPIDATEKGDCFTPPTKTAAYKTEAVAFAIADPSALVLHAGTVTVINTSLAMMDAVNKVAIGALQFFSDTITITTTPPSDAKATSATNSIVNKLYGSSLDNLSPEDKKELLGSGQGAGVVLSQKKDKPLAMLGGVVEGTSTDSTYSPQADAVDTPPLPAPTPVSIFPSSSNGPVWTSGGGSGASLASDLAPVVVAAAQETSTPEVVSDSTSTPPTSDEPTTTPEVVVPTGAPIVDNFDAYDGTGWSVWPSDRYPSPYVLLGLDNGTECHTGSCLISGGGIGGLGTYGFTPMMYKESGIAQSQGAFTVWIRARLGWRRVAANVGLCAGVSLGCISPNLYWFSDIAPQDDTWHQYYFAWKQGDTKVETCMLRDDTNKGNCVWSDTGMPAGTQFDGVMLNGNTARTDLGDQIWFDDLAGTTSQM